MAPLIKFYILNLDLEIHPAPEFIFQELITDIERDPFVDPVKFVSHVKCNGRKYFKRIFFLDQRQLQMFPVGPNSSAIPVVHYVF